MPKLEQEAPNMEGFVPIFPTGKEIPAVMVRKVYCDKCESAVEATGHVRMPYHIDEVSGKKFVVGPFWMTCNVCGSQFWYPEQTELGIQEQER